MSTKTTEISRLVSFEREQYLHKAELKIRSAATAALAATVRPDASISMALDAVLHAEDLADRHEIAAAAWRSQNNTVRANEHDIYAAKATQLKLRSLDQLSYLVL